MALAKHARDKKRGDRSAKDSRRGGKLVSPGVAEIADKGLGFVKGFLARDLDGHGLQLVEK